MNWRPASLSVLRRRAQMLCAAREFFKARAVLEVETPILSATAVSDPQIESLRTRIAGMPGDFFLGSSPEYAMKRLLAAGSGDVFQICKVFRDEQRGRWHNPEFTMIEWYRVGFDDAALMDEVELLLAAMLARPLPAAERLSYGAAMQRHAGVDAFTASDAELDAAAARRGIACETLLDRDAKLDLLMGTIVGPALGIERPCFICDYPPSQAALARVKLKTAANPATAARFELYMSGLELANGFHELTDAAEQRRRFVADLATRRERGQHPPALDERLLQALAAGMPDCAGVALGFDRLAAIALGAGSLAEAMAFPIDGS